MIRLNAPSKFFVVLGAASVFAVSFLAGWVYAAPVMADDSCPACQASPSETDIVFTPSCQGLSSVYYVLLRVTPTIGGTGAGTRSTACLYDSNVKLSCLSSADATLGGSQLSKIVSLAVPHGYTPDEVRVFNCEDSPSALELLTGTYLLCGQCLYETIPANWSAGDCATCQVGFSSGGMNNQLVRCTPNLGVGSCSGSLLGYQQAKVDLENQTASTRHGFFWYETVVGCTYTDTTNASGFVLNAYETVQTCGEGPVLRSSTDGVWRIFWVVLDGPASNIQISDTYHATRSPTGDYEDQFCGLDGDYTDHDCNDVW